MTDIFCCSRLAICEITIIWIHSLFIRLCTLNGFDWVIWITPKEKDVLGTNGKLIYFMFQHKRNIVNMGRWVVRGKRGIILRLSCLASEGSVREKGYSISGHTVRASVELCETDWIGLKYTRSASKPCPYALRRNVDHCACQWGGRFPSVLQRVYRTLGVGVFCTCVYLYLRVCLETEQPRSRSMGGIVIEYCFLSSEVPWEAVETMWDGNYISYGQREKSQPHFHLLTLMTENQYNAYSKQIHSKKIAVGIS